MNEIIRSITDAEERATQIKAEALKKAEKIGAAAEAEVEENVKKCETDCKLYRDAQIKKAERQGAEEYEKTISQKREEGRKYADSVIKRADGTIKEIVRRVARGDC